MILSCICLAGAVDRLSPVSSLHLLLLLLLLLLFYTYATPRHERVNRAGAVYLLHDVPLLGRQGSPDGFIRLQRSPQDPQTRHDNRYFQSLQFLAVLRGYFSWEWIWKKNAFINRFSSDSSSIEMECLVNNWFPHMAVNTVFFIQLWLKEIWKCDNKTLCWQVLSVVTKCRP